MSTQIYHGYKLPPQIQTLAQTLAWKNRLIQAFEADLPKILGQEICSHAVNLIDLTTTQRVMNTPIGHYDSPNALSAAFDHWREKLREENSHQKRTHQFQLTILHGRGKNLCLLHSLGDRAETLLRKKGKATPYIYQNSTDKPKEIPEREWEERRKTWDEALGHNPSKEGLFAQSEDPTWFFWDIKKLPPTIPTPYKRARKQAINHLLTLKLNQIPKEHLLSSFMQIHEALHTDPHQKKQIEGLTKFLIPHLPKIYSWRCLHNFSLRTKEKISP